MLRLRSRVGDCESLRSEPGAPFHVLPLVFSPKRSHVYLLQQRFTRLHAVVMTLSNIILLGLCAWHWTWDEFTWVPKAASTLACIALVTGRQFEGEVPLPQGVAKWLASDSDKME